ncbi:MAG: heavy-metal-associated domain-containing protein [Bacteroidota bacterium]
MIHTYKITGMTCSGCSTSVMEHLSRVDGVEKVEVSLERGTAEVTMESPIATKILKAALSQKYTLSEIPAEKVVLTGPTAVEKTKIQQLKPLLLIFLYLISASFLLNFKNWQTTEAMLDFMGLFYIVFSFFKFLDLKGFPVSFRMYDPLAKAVPAYGWAYPFIELALGLMFLMRVGIVSALVITLVILGITTIGVTRSLLDKRHIRCACLGTALKLPMTEATFIENTIMLVMALGMLSQLV